MPFEKGNQHSKSRRTFAGGRPPRDVEGEVRSLFDQAWPVPDRLDTIRVHVALAKAGNEKSLKLLLAYTYGTPPSGDELRIQDAVEDALEDLYATLEKSLSEGAWREFCGVVGIREGGEAPGDDGDSGGPGGTPESPALGPEDTD